MDKETIEAYNREAESIARLHSTLTPLRVYELIDQYFIKGEPTLDVGCGIGRDTHWLMQQGFLTTGIDVSEQMLKQAQSLYPSDKFFQDDLPDLNQLGVSQFQNILCSAVLMQLSPIDLKIACNRLLQLLNAKGCLVISFRGTHETGNREKGKLYETINIDEFLNIFEENYCKVLIQESETETSRNLALLNKSVFKHLNHLYGIILN